MPTEPTVVLLHGDEQFLVSREARKLLGSWRSELVSDFGFEGLEATRLSAAQLRDAILQAPFLDPYRVVAARSIAPARTEALAAALEEVPPTTRVLLTASGALGKGNRLLKTVAALPNGKVTEFAALKGRRLSEWAAERARELQLGANVAAQVVRVAPPDLGVIDAELRKLADYRRSGYALDAAALKELLAGGREDEFFQLTDRLLPRPKADAWRVTDNLRQNGASATTIAYRLARQLALVLEVRLRQERGQDLAQVQAEMREHPFVVQKAYEAARATTPARLESGLRLLLDYEWEVKSGQIDADLGLDVALAKM